jgi:hypothetical protein
VQRILRAVRRKPNLKLAADILAGTTKIIRAEEVDDGIPF